MESAYCSLSFGWPNRHQAVSNVNTIIGPALVGKQTDINNFMVQQLDRTVNEWGWCKQKLGENAILVVSLAVCKAGEWCHGLQGAPIQGSMKVVLHSTIQPLGNT